MKVELLCGDAAQQAEMSGRLVSAGMSVSPNADLNLIVDEPMGWASLPRDVAQTVIVSRNHCPAYRLDLHERGPAALIFPKNTQSILLTLNLVAEGETVHPNVHTPLTPAERYTIRYTARGYTNKLPRCATSARAELRIYSLTVDGYFGPGTESVVKSFQSSKNLSADGIVGKNTWEALAVTVKQGSQGDAVRAVQTKLGITVDGIFGTGTKAAVAEFQDSKGLVPDCVVGPNTWAALVGGKGCP